MAKRNNEEDYNLVVLADRREQTPWTFSSSKYVIDIRDTTLDTGDYSLEGYEDLVRIERKASTSEIAGNITEKRFKDWLERLSTYKYKFLICEFDFEDIVNFPNNSGIPKYLMNKIKISPAFIMAAMSKIQLKYGIQIIYAGNPRNAQIAAESIFKTVVQIEG
jgi:ERCC4-type nuclease